jgi:hypothetical protein
VNYLRGEDPVRWRTAIPTFARVVYENVYPGIDMVLYGNQRRLEYDFVAAPGADPRLIGVVLAGADGLSLSPDGDLIVSTTAGDVRLREPFVYQEVAGDRRTVEAAYSLDGARIGFRLGDYDPSRRLVIDPVLDYSTFLGGFTSYDAANGIAVDASGAAYVAGYTFSSDFPTTAGAYDRSVGAPAVCAPAEDPGFQPPPAGRCLSDAFVTKLSPDGKDLVYSTFLGGSRSDRAQDIAVDGEGSAYVAGGTDSTDFPTTPGATDATAAGSPRVIGVGLVVLAEAFLAKLAPDGASLDYSTYLGGDDAEEGSSVEVDPSGAAYVAGHVFSTDLPTTLGAFDTFLNTPDAPPGIYPTSS